MASSPWSTASSSDLYAPSEHTEESIPIQFRGDESQVKDVTHPAHAALSSSASFSPEVRKISDTVQRHTTHVQKSGFNGSGANLQHKRKRDEDREASYTFDTGPRGSGLESQEHNLPDIGQQVPQPHVRPSPEAPLGFKRIRLNGPSDQEPGPGDAQVRVGPLSPELWHHVFRFVPPVFLGRLLRVNRAFLSYLTCNPNRPKPAVDRSYTGLRPLDADTIWAASRKRFAPGLPKPLRGLQELDMWRLLRGRNCQLCGMTKNSGAVSGVENPWETGPGEETEVDLLLSSACPSFLLPALPFAFVSSSMNYIPNSILRESAAPSATKIVKRFYNPHVQQIQEKLDRVRELGTASAEEWSKGLVEEGRERINDAVRWEQWEAKGGLKRVNMRPQAKPIVTSVSANVARHPPRPSKIAELNGSAMQFGSGLPRYDGPPSSGLIMTADTQQYSQSLPMPFQDPSLTRASAPLSTSRPERTIKDVNEAKAARRAEIERRCTLFDPPLPAHILSHMESFQAAIQISTPLTDAAWDVLKPRLLNQRASAEKREQEQVQQNELLQAEFKQRRYQETQLKESKDSIDRHWDSAQAPVRDKLGALADSAIDERWSGGRAVTKENSPQFAADILVHVRQRFYDDIAHATEAATVSGQPVKRDPPSGPPTQTLTLENMKWLFDTKIRPLTEHYQRELFLCNGCDDNFKFYGFEGVIQHYAAKHTSSLSMGSVVVYWRAEWPEQPPFNPEPSLSKSAHYKVPSPAAGGPNSWNNLEPHPFFPGSNYGAVIGPEFKQTVDGSALYSNAIYRGGQRAPYLDTSYAPSYRQVYSSTPTSAAASSGLPSGLVSCSASSQVPQWQGTNTIAASMPNSGGYDTGGRQATYGYSNGYSPQGANSGLNSGIQSSYRAAAARPPHFDPSRNSAAQLTEAYQQQMDEMAKQARDVWHNTSNIRDFPASVRIYVVIHNMAARVSQKFSTIPSLAMFLDGLDNNAQMRPVRSLNGLACRICVTQYNTPFASNLQSQPPASDRRLFTLPHLLNHFRTVHLKGPQAFASPNSGPNGPKHDWTRDMIELPEIRLIADLVHSVGMDDTKLELIAWAFPHVFPSPLPRLAVLRHSGLPSNYSETPLVSAPYHNDGYVQSRNFHPSVAPSGSSKDRADERTYDRPQGANRSVSRLSQPSEPPGEDEYDPHKPAYQGNLGMAGVNVETSEIYSKYPAGRVRDRFEPQQLSNDGPLPETTDLSRLIYNATGMRPVHESPGQLVNQQQQHNSGNLLSPSFSKSEHDANAGVRGRYVDKRTINGDRYRHDHAAGHCAFDGTDVESKSLHDNAHSPPSDAHVRAAERFLQTLGQTADMGPNHGPEKHEQNNERNSIHPRANSSRDEDSEVRPYSARSANHVGRIAQTTHETSPDNSAHTSRPMSRSVRNVSPSPIQVSELYSHANYRRAASNTWLHNSEPGINGWETHTYSEYPTSYRTFLEDRLPRDSHTTEVADGSHNALRTAHPPYHRDRPRSPVPVTVDTPYYRSNSPTDEVQPQPTYRIRSSLARAEANPQRTFYECPREDRYEVVEEHDYHPSSKNRYAQRIEYVPVRMGNQIPPDPSRYIIAKDLGVRDRVDYVRLEDTYDAGAVYRRDGQLYHSEARTYQAPLARGSAGTGSGSGPSYPY
ncbi:MAG: hypothetical protein Q9219_006536 [cf. Caloplaca sp. 3 TL-2023]